MNVFVWEKYLWAWVLVLGLLASACPYQKTKPAREETPARSLETGQTVTVEFAADGRWHPAPILVRNQEVIEIKPGEAAADLSAESLRFRVGEVPQMLRPGERVLITMPGKLWFMVDKRFAPGEHGPVTVIIKRVK